MNRLTADDPDAWSSERESEVSERLRASLTTDEDRTLLDQLCDHYTNAGTTLEEAAFLLGREVGRRAQVGVKAEPMSTTADDEPAGVLRRDANGNVVPFTPEELMEARRPTLEDVLTEAINAVRLAQTVRPSSARTTAPRHS